MTYTTRARSLLLLLVAGTACAPLWAAAAPTPDHTAAGGPSANHPHADHSKPALDRSGRERVGKASFYAKSFSGKKMADGTPMRPQGNNAASRTLPLGTTAMVTNLQSGKRAIVTIRDRGPYVKGRIVDLSPSTARKIGITPKEGVAKVAVAPLEVPLSDGTLKPGVSDAEAKKIDRQLLARNRR